MRRRAKTPSPSPDRPDGRSLKKPRWSSRGSGAGTGNGRIDDEDEEPDSILVKAQVVVLVPRTQKGGNHATMQLETVRTQPQVMRGLVLCDEGLPRALPSLFRPCAQTFQRGGWPPAAETSPDPRRRHRRGCSVLA